MREVMEPDLSPELSAIAEPEKLPPVQAGTATPAVNRRILDLAVLTGTPRPRRNRRHS